jgi:hypothetical protein
MKENNRERVRGEKVQARLVWIRRALAAHDSHLALLEDFAKGQRTLFGKGYTRKAENYQQTRADKARLPRTLANVQAQRDALLQELQTLLEYSA